MQPPAACPHTVPRGQASPRKGPHTTTPTHTTTHPSMPFAKAYACHQPPLRTSTHTPTASPPPQIPVTKPQPTTQSHTKTHCRLLTCHHQSQRPNPSQSTNQPHTQTHVRLLTCHRSHDAGLAHPRGSHDEQALPRRQRQAQVSAHHQLAVRRGQGQLFQRHAAVAAGLPAAGPRRWGCCWSAFSAQDTRDTKPVPLPLAPHPPPSPHNHTTGGRGQRRHRERAAVRPA